MRMVVKFAPAAALLTAACLVWAQEKPAAKPAPRAAGAAKAPMPKTPATNAPAAKVPATKAPATKTPVTTEKSVPSEKTPAETKPAVPGAKAPAKATPERTEDEQAIRTAAQSYAESYTQGDAATVAAHFASDAEYVDHYGNVVHGRAAIERALTQSLKAAPGGKLEVAVDTVRFLGPALAVEEGTARTTPPKGTPVDIRYTAVHSKSDGQWLIVSVRDQAITGNQTPAERLAALSWLVGEWIDEGEGSVIEFNCQPASNGNFLIRDFTIRIAGKEALQGTQRIGWDAQRDTFRVWSFDSKGGFNEGTLHATESGWMLRTSGVTAEGLSSSSTSLFTPVDDNAMTWQAFNIVVADQRMPDTGLTRIVRKPPQPK